MRATPTHLCIVTFVNEMLSDSSLKFNVASVYITCGFLLKYKLLWVCKYTRNAGTVMDPSQFS